MNINNINTNRTIQESLKLKKKALALLSKAIAKIILKFHLPRSEFISALDENLVLQAKKQDPDASNVAIAIRTGIDRRYISKHLRGEMPVAKPDKMAVILGDIRWTAHKFYKSDTIPKSGPFRTFQSICEARASGTLTYKAILEELIKTKNIQDLGNKIRVINFKFNNNMNEIDYSQLTATQIDRTVNTLIYNSNKEFQKDKLIQRTIYSTQVHPKNHFQLHIKLEPLIEKQYKEVASLIVRYEDDVEIGTYPQYGISFLEYKAEE